MKNAIIFCSLLFAGNAFALYGSKVTPSVQPYVVALEFAGNYFCSGVLISPTKVLTAGHCIEMQGASVHDHSHGFIYNPKDVTVSVGDQKIIAESISFSPAYFEGSGLEGEDLALIELSQSTKVLPIAFARRSDLLPDTSLTYYARGKKTDGKLTYAKFLDRTTALILDMASGACLGDSGGAIVLNKNGQQRLAGILMYSGGGFCEAKPGYGHFPKLRFSEYY